MEARVFGRQELRDQLLKGVTILSRCDVWVQEFAPEAGSLQVVRH